MSATPAELAAQLGSQLGPVNAAAVAELQAATAAALALYVQGDIEAARAVLGGPPATVHGQTTELALMAGFTAAVLAINAAVGDDPTRGYCALSVLHERAADYRSVCELLRRGIHE